MKRSDIRKKLDPVVKAAMKELEVPGVAVGLRIEGENHTFGYGQTNIEHGRPVDGETLFQIGSTSKTFAATAAMQLVEEGKLSLDDKVVDHLPRFKVPDAETASGVTIRHLVTHTSGWMGDWPGTKPTGRGDDALRKRVANMSRVPHLAPLGSVWSYNNLGFTLLGHVIEQITKKTFEQVVTDKIMKPLGMENSFYFPEEVMVRKFALGHVKTPEGWKIVRPWAQSRATGPSGGVVSTAEDQMTYAQFHLGEHPEGKKVLTKKTIRQMQKPLVAAASLGSHVGVSWLLDEIQGARTVAHGGTMVGQTSAFMMVPAREFAITVLTNAGAEGSQLHRRVVKESLSRFLGLERPAHQPAEIAPETLAEIAGSYRFYTYGTIEVEAGEDNLTLTWKPTKKALKQNPSIQSQLPAPLAIRPIGDLRFTADEGMYAGAVIDFVRDGDGRIGWLRMGGRIQPRVS